MDAVVVDTQRPKETEAAASTSGPITDITRTTTTGDEEAKASPSTPTSTSPPSTRDDEGDELTTSANTNSNTSSNPNSKIPHPTLTALLASKTNQFRRSASLRLRGSKSNLLFNNTFVANNSKSNNESSSSNNTMNSNPHTRGDNKLEHMTTRTTASSTTPTTARTGSTGMTEPEVVAHDLATTAAAGRVSPRRKLVLNSQLPAVGLTRSLSLRVRNQNNKTDSNAESCTASESSKDRLSKDNIGNCVSQETGEHHHQKSTEDPHVQGIHEANGIDKSPDKTKAKAGNEITTRSQDNVDGPGVQLTQQQENHKMSLTLNGPTTTAPTTTTTTTTTTTNARPSSLATSATNTTTGSSNSSNTSSKTAFGRTTTSASPKTPKTPTTPQLTNHHNHGNHIATTHSHSVHHHHHNNHCSKQQQHQQQQQQQVLPSVPETKLTPRTPPVTPDSPSTYLEDDLDSLYSFATTTSGRSTMSCEHPYVARNGTTFSGRKMKYVVHCSNHAGQVGPDYLTPTQRAQRQIRRLKELLCVARQDLEQKDSEILRLTREVVELRLFKASLSSPEDRSASSDAVTVREADLKTSQDVSPIVDMVDDAAKSSPRHILAAAGNHAIMQQHSEMQSSFADSGHFDDMTTSSVHSKDSSYAAHTHDIGCGNDEAETEAEEQADGACGVESYEMQRQELIRMYEQRIEELIRTQDSSVSEMKRSHNDKVEALLQKLAECNTRYADIVPDYEHAKERIRELEKQLEDLQRKLAEHEEKQNKMYLHMYQKGQEAERIARADQALELAHRAPSNKVSINELLHQLQSTQDELENIRAAECRNETGGNHALLTAKEAISLWVLGARKTIYRRLLDAQKNRTHVDPEVTLQFLKSAVYYFLTDKENSQGHLQAIESILEFTEAEKQNINKARSPK